MRSSLNKVFGFIVFDIIETVVIALAIFVIIYVFIASPHVIVGASMDKSFANGEFLLVNKLAYRVGSPQRGDVIVFKFDPTHDYIKRIIGLPGDKILLSGGNVYLNGKMMNENPYVTPGNLTYGLSFLQNDSTITIPDNKYFVMGDNREESSDSRAWGFVDKSAIDGKVWIVYWPFNEVELVPNVNYTFGSNNINASLQRL